MPKLPWTLISLLTHYSMLPLRSRCSSEKTYQVSGVNIRTEEPLLLSNIRGSDKEPRAAPASEYQGANSDSDDASTSMDIDITADHSNSMFFHATHGVL